MIFPPITARMKRTTACTGNSVPTVSVVPFILGMFPRICDCFQKDNQPTQIFKPNFWSKYLNNQVIPTWTLALSPFTPSYLDTRPFFFPSLSAICLTEPSAPKWHRYMCTCKFLQPSMPANRSRCDKWWCHFGQKWVRAIDWSKMSQASDMVNNMLVYGSQKYNGIHLLIWSKSGGWWPFLHN